MRGKKLLSKIIILAMMVSLLCAFSVPSDISASEYMFPSDNAEVDGWSVTSDGENLIFTYGGKTSSPYWYCTECAVSFADGTMGAFQLVAVPANGTGMLKYNWGDVAAISVTGSVEGDYFGTFTLPLSFFNQEFTLSYCGYSVSSADITGNVPEQPETQPSEEVTEAEPTEAETVVEATEAEPTEAETVVEATEAEPTEAETAVEVTEAEPTEAETVVEVTEAEPTEAETVAEPTEAETVEEATEQLPPSDGGTGAASANISIDGNLVEWTNVDSRTSTDTSIDEWKIVKDAAGNVYLSFTGTAVTQWYGDYQWKGVEISQNGQSQWHQMAGLQYVGGEFAAVNMANHNTPGPYYVEAFIPASAFTDPNYTIAFAGTSIPASAVPEYAYVEEEKAPAVYNGIVIDGQFNDWDAVVKTEIGDAVENPYGNLSQTAVVFDGDYVYIYLKETPGGSASNAGSHGNAQYAITSDVNQTIVFQLTNDGSVYGVEGATASHVGAQWEIAIPASQLPNYINTINFGLYLTEPFITGVANLNGQGSGNSFNGIEYDGLYADWNFYPHTLIQYATAGTHQELADAEGALYSSGATLFGHTYTTMPEHLSTGAYEMTQAITFKFNDSENYLFYPRFVTIDENGNINWNPDWDSMKGGPHRLYMMSLDAWATSTNISNLNEMDQIYGEMLLTVGESRMECEYIMDTAKVAKKLELGENDIKTISVQFGRLGQQWITTTGASSGALLGILLCCGSVASVVGFKAYKKKSTKAV